MKKKIAVILFSFFTFLLAAAVVLPFIIDVNRYKAPLLKAIESKVNAHVELGRISLSFFPYLGFRLQNLRVTPTEQDFLGTPLLQLEDLNFNILLRGFLKREIQAKLILKKPVIQIIQKGTLSNLDNLSKEESSPAQKEPFDLKKSLPFIRKVVVEEIRMNDGEVILQGTSTQKISGIHLLLSHIDLMEPSKPVRVDLGMKLLGSSKENFSLKGEAQVDAITKKFNLSLSASLFELDSLLDLMPDLAREFPPDSKVAGAVGLQITAQGTPKAFTGKTHIDFKETLLHYGSLLQKEKGSTTTLDIALSNTAEGTNLNLNGSLAAEKLKISGNNVSGLTSTFSFAKKIADLKELKGHLWDGEFSGSGSVNLANAKPSWNLDIKVNQVDMNKALTEMADLPEMMTGRGSLSFKLSGEGNTKGDIKKSVSGLGDISLTNGEFKPVNLTKRILSEQLLSALTTVTSAASLIAGQTNQWSPPAFASKYNSTPFNELKGKLTIQEGILQLPALKLAHDTHSIDLNGTLNLDLALNLKGRYALSKSETQSWITNEKLRSLLVDQEGQFLVPFAISGPVQSPLVTPDVSYVKDLAQKAVASFAKQQIQEQVIQKVLPQAPELLKNLPKLF